MKEVGAEKISMQGLVSLLPQEPYVLVSIAVIHVRLNREAVMDIVLPYENDRTTSHSQNNYEKEVKND
jgi:hypothetical protein|tara:strand:+ start:889 stop:1092 length:204 start_codon:yes stop_codon:yes gene_type:complete